MGAGGRGGGMTPDVVDILDSTQGAPMEDEAQSDVDSDSGQLF